MKQIVFVSMPFDSGFHSGFVNVIQPAVEKAGGVAVRADSEKMGHIHTQMFDRIIDSRALVIDLSGLNPNVFYEMGVAHALHKRSIMVVGQNHLKKIPFDIAPYRVLVYPDPDSAPAAELAAAVDRLAGEIRDILDHPETGVPNPVMDFLASRSPVTAAQTLYLPSLREEHEREILLGTRHHLTYVGLTGQIAFKVVEFIENEMRSPDFELRLRLLDPKFEAGWRFMLDLQEGSPVPEDEFRAYLDAESAVQRRAILILKKLAARFPGFKLDVQLYHTVPLFWAYGWDDAKWAVGHYAMQRIQARGLPVTVVAASDPHSTALFSHYSTIIRNLPVTPG